MPSPPLCDISYVGDDDSMYFRRVFDRTLPAGSRYMLPVDEEEIKRAHFHHRMIQFIFSGKHYIGPVEDTLNRSAAGEKRVIDLGTGSGHWAIDIADAFPEVEVVGMDIVPIQPREVPPNCTFELCDLDDWIGYPDCTFDVVHARALHTGIKRYPSLLREIARVLKPGGLVILIEPDILPIPGIYFPDAATLPGWCALFDAYRACLKRQCIDLTVPRRLADLLVETDEFQRIVKQEANYPIGMWPKDPISLTIGQLAWQDYDMLLPALKPILRMSGLSDTKVNQLVQDAQKDLYYPKVDISARLHIAHAIKA